VTTQYVGEAAYCDRVAVMRNGRLMTVDTPEGLRRQAMEGDVIHLQLAEGQSHDVKAFLKALPEVNKVERVPNEPEGLYVFVEDAGRELPLLLATLLKHKGVTPQVAEPYQPPFDEVFVRLIQRSEASQ
jgi:ABC-2 type transport system ATP-binding protein